MNLAALLTAGMHFGLLVVGVLMCVRGLATTTVLDLVAGAAIVALSAHALL